MLVIVARAMEVRPANKLGPSTKIQWMVASRVIELARPANDNRRRLIAVPDTRKEG